MWIGLFSLTLQRQDLAGLDHDAELQHQLGGALQEGLEQPQHADVRALEHHAPVVVTPLGVAVPAALNAQIQGVDVPANQRNTHFCQHVVSKGEKKKREGAEFWGFNAALQKLSDIKHRLSEVITHYSKLWKPSVVLAKKR